MRIIDCIRPDKQTVMFSATFPRQMEALARKILDKPIEVMYLLRYGKTGNMQPVLQHCCRMCLVAMLRVLSPSSNLSCNKSGCKQV